MAYTNAHSVHAVARGSVEETPATFRMLSPLPGGNPTTATAGCARWCRYWHESSSSSSSARQPTARHPESQVLAFARVCRSSVELFCLLPKEHTHATGCRKSGDQVLHMHVPWVEKLASQRLLSSYVCLPLPLTCRPFVCSVQSLLFV
jgi:hypothetical protein